MKKASIIKNTIFNMVKTLSALLFPLITIPYVTRVLGVDNYGKINFGSSIINYFTLIAALGLTTYAIRECSRIRDDRAKLSQLASELFSINMITTVISYGLLAVLLIFFPKFQGYRQLIIIQSTVILMTTVGCDWLNSAMEDFQYISLRTIGFQIVSLVLMFLLVRDSDDYLMYAIISAISAGGANLLNIRYRRRYCDVRFTTQIPLKRHFVPIMLLFVMSLAQTVFTSADMTMLGLIKSDYEVGIYSTAIKIERMISQVVSSNVFVLMPRMSYLYATGDQEKINATLRKILAVFLVIGLPCFAGAFAISDDLILLVAGADYAAAGLPLKIAMFSFLFSLLGGSFLGNVVLLSSGKEKAYMIICCVTAALNVVLNAILIPVLGAVGATITTAFCSFVMLVLLMFPTRKTVKLEKIGKLFFAPILGGLLIIAYCLLIMPLIPSLFPRIAVCVAGSCILYLAVLLVTKNEVLPMVLSKVKKRLKK